MLGDGQSDFLIGSCWTLLCCPGCLEQKECQSKASWTTLNANTGCVKHSTGALRELRSGCSWLSRHLKGWPPPGLFKQRALDCLISQASVNSAYRGNHFQPRPEGKCLCCDRRLKGQCSGWCKHKPSFACGLL